MYNRSWKKEEKAEAPAFLSFLRLVVIYDSRVYRLWAKERKTDTSNESVSLPFIRQNYRII